MTTRPASCSATAPSISASRPRPRAASWGPSCTTQRRWIYGRAATPVINYPEVAIVGVNRIAERPVVLGGQIVVRRMMNLSSSFDHRIVDGWEAASFIQRIKDLLEQPALLFIA